MAGIKAHFVSSDFRHEFRQCLFEFWNAVVVLEKSKLTENGFSVSLESGCVWILRQPRLENIEAEL